MGKRLKADPTVYVLFLTYDGDIAIKGVFCKPKQARKYVEMRYGIDTSGKWRKSKSEETRTYQIDKRTMLTIQASEIHGKPWEK